MISGIPPVFIFLLGALLVPAMKGRAKVGLLLAIPVVAFLNVLLLPDGTSWTYQFLGHELIFAQVDKMSLCFGYIFCIAAFTGLLYGLQERDDRQYITMLVYVGSSIGAVFAGDYLTLFLFWELMTFSAAVLIWAGNTEAAGKAGMHYLLVHVFGGFCLLAGIVIQTAKTGSTAFGYLGLDGLGSVLIFLAFIINAAIPPLHAWLTDSYPESTITGTVFLTAYTTKTAVYVLARAFPGEDILIYLGAFMTVYPIFYAVIENDARRVLAYSMVNQVGFMITGIGIGTALALNGAVSHAFNDILFKSLLMMTVGAVMYVTGKSRCTDLGGLYRTMPITTVFCLIGAASISAFPLFSGFVSKSMVIAAAAEGGYSVVWFMLLFASAGVFHHAGIKIPYFIFFAHDSGLRPKEPPMNMLLAMGIVAGLCVFIGMVPGPLYSLLPFPVDYHPFTAAHVVGQLQLLLFSALAFIYLMVKGHYPPELVALNLDTDWLYRKAAKLYVWVSARPVVAAENALARSYRSVGITMTKRVANWSFAFDREVIDRMVNGVATMNRYGANSSAWIEKYVIYAGLNWIGYGYHVWARVLRRFQTGMVHNYAAMLIFGFVLLANLVLFWIWYYGPPTGSIF